MLVGIPSMTFGEHADGETTGRLVLCAERDRAGERHLITGENTTMDALVAEIARQAGGPEPRAIPLPVAGAAARLDGWRYRLPGDTPPRLTDSAIAVMASGQFLDGAKAQRELGYRPESSLVQAIARSLAGFRRAGRC